MTNIKKTKVKKSDKTIPNKIANKLLDWCERYCCFCGKNCKTHIQIHHIDGNDENNNEDNLIPVCFDCHDELTQNSTSQSLGRKYSDLEIKRRREETYEHHTQKYVGSYDIQISKYFHPWHPKIPKGQLVLRKVGDISCTIIPNPTNKYPVKMRLSILPYKGKRKLSLLYYGPHFRGEVLRPLFPRRIVFDHFPFPHVKTARKFDFKIKIQWSIIDKLEKEHKMPTLTFILDNPTTDWWFYPGE